MRTGVPDAVVGVTPKSNTRSLRFEIMSSLRRAPRRPIAAIATLAVAASSVVALGSTPAAANPNSTSDVIAYLVEGTGDGHGRGMSQWGAYGWAVDEGWSWERILDHYYAGTELGAVDTARRITVRLTEWDGSSVFGVVSTSSSARWSSPAHSASNAHSAIRIVEAAPNSFTISVASAPQCIGASTLTVPDGPVSVGSTAEDEVERIQTFLTAVGFDPRGIDGDFGPLTESAVRAFQIANGLPTDGVWDIDDATAARVIIGNSTSDEGWTEVASGVPGPVVVSTDVNESSASVGDVLGLCEASGRVVHYRGALRFLHNDVGNRVVNDVGVENYLRGVVPREVSPSWGDRGDGRGMNALRAQAVAARGYGLEQSRYVYAQTCDTMACQVYGGAATRANIGAGAQSVEAAQTDRAIADTAGRVRVWAAGNPHGIAPGTIASTEFSASNGPQTAGGAFPSIADPADATSLNPSHRWTRVISVAALRSAYSGADPGRVTTVVDPASPYQGIYANRVRLDDGEHVSAWSFRGQFDLPSPGFTLSPVTRGVAVDQSLYFIGDSVGASVANELPALLSGVFTSYTHDAISSRRTAGGSVVPDGVGAAAAVPGGTDIVVVELGYNDDPAALAGRIDQVMATLSARGVGVVIWTTMSERRQANGVSRYAPANAALESARGRWSNLIVVDWAAASDDSDADRWYSDGVHLTSTGQAEFAVWLRSRILEVTDPAYIAVGELEQMVPVTPARLLDTRTGAGVRSVGKVTNGTIEVQVLGEGGVPGTAVSAVALNVTAVEAATDQSGGYLTVFPCGTRPNASNLNFRSGQTIANSVIAPVSDRGTVCFYVRGAAHLLADVSAYFPSSTDFVALNPGRVLDTRTGNGAAVGSVTDSTIEVPVLGRAGLPGSGVAAVALNLTVDQARSGPGGGFVTVFPCGTRPNSSNLNFTTGQTIANAVIAPVSASGTVCVYVSGGAHLIADVSGYFPNGADYTPLSPVRVVDTRATGRVGATDGSGGPLEVDLSGLPGVDTSRMLAASLNITVVNSRTSSAGGYVTVYPCRVRPNASNVNFVTGLTIANGVIAPVSRFGKVCIYVYGEADLLVDVNGVVSY